MLYRKTRLQPALFNNYSTESTALITISTRRRFNIDPLAWEGEQGGGEGRVWDRDGYCDGDAGDRPPLVSRTLRLADGSFSMMLGSCSYRRWGC